jgi:hypothetical protein
MGIRHEVWTSLISTTGNSNSFWNGTSNVTGSIYDEPSSRSDVKPLKLRSKCDNAPLAEGYHTPQKAAIDGYYAMMNW